MFVLEKCMYYTDEEDNPTKFYKCNTKLIRVPRSVDGIATGYGLGDPGIESRWEGARFSAPVRTRPGAHPASCTMGTGSFLGVKSGQGVTLIPHLLLVPWSFIPVLPLWAVRPVQSLSACTRMTFNFSLP